MSPSVPELKGQLRRQLRAASRTIMPSEREAASEQIRQRLRGQEIWQKAQAVLFYLPLADEPDVWPLATEALGLGKQVALPRYSAEEDVYAVCSVEDLSNLRVARFGLLEPNSSCPLFNLNRLDITLVPGIGFDVNGHRLGRGKGYYDRLLAQVAGIKCGVAFDWQVAAEIPTEPHDVRLDCILTPTLWQDVAGRARF